MNVKICLFKKIVTENRLLNSDFAPIDKYIIVKFIKLETDVNSSDRCL